MITKFETIKCTCNKCQYDWIPNNGIPPKICPRCKSYYWNTEQKSV